MTTVFTRDERWDLEVIRGLLPTLQPDHYDLPTLNGVLQNADERGYVKVPYTRERSAGRVYSKHSYQNLSGKIRTKCARQFYHDYDIVNAFPVIMVQVFQQYGIKCDALVDYVNNRDAIFAGIMDQYPLTRDEIKKCFLISLFFGNYRRSVTDGIYVKVIDNFSKAIKQASITLSEHKDFQPLLKEAEEHIKASGKTWKKPIATMLSWVCQDREFKIVEKFFEGLPRGPYMFDGEMLENELDEIELKRRSAIVKNKLKLRVQVVKKPMVDTDPPRHEYEKGERVVMFDLDGTLAFWQNGWKFRPGLERLKELTSKFKVGIFTNKSRKNIPLEDLERIAGVRFSSVLGSEECYRPSNSYLAVNPGLDQYDRLKPLRTFFPLDQVILVDDTPAKVHTTERHRCLKIASWRGGSRDTELHTIIDRLKGTILFASETISSTLNEGELGKWRFGTATEVHDEKQLWCDAKVFGQRKVTVLAAEMGMGKTTATLDFVKREADRFELETKRPYRILIVGCRRSMGLSSTKLYREKLSDVTHYKEFKHDQTKIFSDRIMCQFESLHKLKDAERFDLVILDEIREVAACYTSKNTNKRNLRKNISIIDFLLKESDRVICTDADAHTDGKVAHWMQSLFEPEEVSVHSYLCKKMNRHLKMTYDANEFETLLKESMAKGTTALPCQSRDKLYYWMMKMGLQSEPGDEALSKLPVPTDEIKWITKDTADSVKLLLSNIDDIVRGTKLIAFTSVITVGSDCQVPVNKIFVDATAKRGFGACARNLMQMIGRFRVCAEVDVIVLINDEEEISDTPNAFAEAMQEMKAKRLACEDAADIYDYVPYFDRGCLDMAPSYVSEMFVYAAAERKRCTAFELERQALRKGWKVTRPCIKPAKETDEESKALKQEVKNIMEYDFKKAHEEVTKFVAENTVPRVELIAGVEFTTPPMLPMDALALLLTKSREILASEKATFFNKQVADITRLMTRFTEPLNLEETVLAEKKLAELTRLTQIKTGDYLMLAENSILRNTGQWHDLLPQDSIDVHRKMLLLLEKLGYEDIHSIANVTTDVFDAHIDDIKQTFKDVNMTHKKKTQTGVPLMKELLKKVYGMTLLRGGQTQIKLPDNSWMKVSPYQLHIDDKFKNLVDKMKPITALVKQFETHRQLHDHRTSQIKRAHSCPLGKRSAEDVDHNPKRLRAEREVVAKHRVRARNTVAEVYRQEAEHISQRIQRAVSPVAT